MNQAVVIEGTDPQPSAQAESGLPQLRTILLTDICDSTALVEQIGDSGAAQFFREHDRLVLRLQNEWRGRLIDRSDGLLLLFERPIDGLGFAIDYARGLSEVGKLRALDVKTRAGLHVGEVLTWRNSEESVLVGSKPVEVEGLAKPIAARLMSMARPGQILLSSVAEPLAHRAARELGERGQHLIWKSLGRWRFKGVHEPQEIFEVGEPGIAPLRAPPNSPKAWRDIPLWRRPAALAAQLGLLAVIGFGAWFTTRPAPAIAFKERDWVVVADLRNLTGQPVLDESLEQAFRISLEQSRYVNVLSDLKTRDTLARMQLPVDTVLDRSVASEIALRDGARAVILPTVAEVGGRVRVSVEVIDPNSQTTVYAQSADGDGAVSALTSIDTVTAELRGMLGEALQSIEKDSEPLPQVTTENLDALRAYALGQERYEHSDYKSALELYQRAAELDPKFGLAWIGQAKANYAMLDTSAAIAPLRTAQVLRSRLAPREVMYLDGWSAELEAPTEALGKWTLMAKLYPDSMPAIANVAIRLVRAGRWEEGMSYAERAIAQQSDVAAFAYDLLGRSHLATEDYAKASFAFNQAQSLGNRESLQRRAVVAAAQRRFTTAERVLQKIPATDSSLYTKRMVFAIDEARWNVARTNAEAALRLINKEHNQYWLTIEFALAVTDFLEGDERAAKRRNQNVVSRALASLEAGTSADAEEVVGLTLSAALLAQQMNDRTLASRVLVALQENPQMSLPNLAELAAVVRAQELRLAGKPQEALTQLKPLLNGHEMYQTHVALLDAYEAAGETEAALEHARWLQSRRGLSYAEISGYQCQQPWNAATSTLAFLRAAELLSRKGHADEARKELANFDLRWPSERLPAYLRARRAAVVEASSLGGI